jgi:hypothetical protein
MHTGGDTAGGARDGQQLRFGELLSLQENSMAQRWMTVCSVLDTIERSA